MKSSGRPQSQQQKVPQIVQQVQPQPQSQHQTAEQWAEDYINLINAIISAISNGNKKDADAEILKFKEMELQAGNYTFNDVTIKRMQDDRSRMVAEYMRLISLPSSIIPPTIVSAPKPKPQRIMLQSNAMLDKGLLQMDMQHINSQVAKLSALAEDVKKTIFTPNTETNWKTRAQLQHDIRTICDWVSRLNNDLQSLYITYPFIQKDKGFADSISKYNTKINECDYIAGECDKIFLVYSRFENTLDTFLNSIYRVYKDYEAIKDPINKHITEYNRINSILSGVSVPATQQYLEALRDLLLKELIPYKNKLQDWTMMLNGYPFKGGDSCKELFKVCTDLNELKLPEKTDISLNQLLIDAIKRDFKIDISESFQKSLISSTVKVVKSLATQKDDLDDPVAFCQFIYWLKVLADKSVVVNKDERIKYLLQASAWLHSKNEWINYDTFRSTVIICMANILDTLVGAAKDIASEIVTPVGIDNLSAIIQAISTVPGTRIEHELSNLSKIDRVLTKTVTVLPGIPRDVLLFTNFIRENTAIISNIVSDDDASFSSMLQDWLNATDAMNASVRKSGGSLRTSAHPLHSSDSGAKNSGTLRYSVSQAALTPLRSEISKTDVPRDAFKEAYKKEIMELREKLRRNSSYQEYVKKIMQWQSTHIVQENLIELQDFLSSNIGHVVLGHVINISKYEPLVYAYYANSNLKDRYVVVQHAAERKQQILIESISLDVRKILDEIFPSVRSGVADSAYIFWQSISNKLKEIFSINLDDFRVSIEEFNKIIHVVKLRFLEVFTTKHMRNDFCYEVMAQIWPWLSEKDDKRAITDINDALEVFNSRGLLTIAKIPEDISINSLLVYLFRTGDKVRFTQFLVRFGDDAAFLKEALAKFPELLLFQHFDSSLANQKSIECLIQVISLYSTITKEERALLIGEYVEIRQDINLAEIFHEMAKNILSVDFVKGLLQANENPWIKRFANQVDQTDVDGASNEFKLAQYLLAMLFLRLSNEIEERYLEKLANAVGKSAPESDKIIENANITRFAEKQNLRNRMSGGFGNDVGFSAAFIPEIIGGKTLVIRLNFLKFKEIYTAFPQKWSDYITKTRAPQTPDQIMRSIKAILDEGRKFMKSVSEHSVAVTDMEDKPADPNLDTYNLLAGFYSKVAELQRRVEINRTIFVGSNLESEFNKILEEIKGWQAEIWRLFTLTEEVFRSILQKAAVDIEEYEDGLFELQAKISPMENALLQLKASNGEAKKKKSFSKLVEGMEQKYTELTELQRKHLNLGGAMGVAKDKYAVGKRLFESIFGKKFIKINPQYKYTLTDVAFYIKSKINEKPYGGFRVGHPLVLKHRQAEKRYGILVLPNSDNLSAAVDSIIKLKMLTRISLVKILFPFNVFPLNPEVLGLGEIKLSLIEKKLNVEVYGHFTCGGGEIFAGDLKQNIEKVLGEKLNGATISFLKSPYTARRQPEDDPNSSGVIVAEELLLRIDDKELKADNFNNIVDLRIAQLAGLTGIYADATLENLTEFEQFQQRVTRHRASLQPLIGSDGESIENIQLKQFREVLNLIYTLPAGDQKSILRNISCSIEPLPLGMQPGQKDKYFYERVKNELEDIKNKLNGSLSRCHDQDSLHQEITTITNIQQKLFGSDESSSVLGANVASKKMEAYYIFVQNHFVNPLKKFDCLFDNICYSFNGEFKTKLLQLLSDKINESNGQSLFAEINTFTSTFFNKMQFKQIHIECINRLFKELFSPDQGLLIVEPGLFKSLVKNRLPVINKMATIRLCILRPIDKEFKAAFVALCSVDIQEIDSSARALSNNLVRMPDKSGPVTFNNVLNDAVWNYVYTFVQKLEQIKTFFNDKNDKYAFEFSSNTMGEILNCFTNIISHSSVGMMEICTIDKANFLYIHPANLARCTFILQNVFDELMLLFEKFNSLFTKPTQISQLFNFISSIHTDYYLAGDKSIASICPKYLNRLALIYEEYKEFNHASADHEGNKLFSHLVDSLHDYCFKTFKVAENITDYLQEITNIIGSFTGPVAKNDFNKCEYARLQLIALTSDWKKMQTWLGGNVLADLKRFLLLDYALIDATYIKALGLVVRNLMLQYDNVFPAITEKEYLKLTGILVRDQSTKPLIDTFNAVIEPPPEDNIDPLEEGIAAIAIELANIQAVLSASHNINQSELPEKLKTLIAIKDSLLLMRRQTQFIGSRIQIEQLLDATDGSFLMLAQYIESRKNIELLLDATARSFPMLDKLLINNELYLTANMAKLDPIYKSSDVSSVIDTSTSESNPAKKAINTIERFYGKNSELGDFLRQLVLVSLEQIKDETGRNTCCAVINILQNFVLQSPICQNLAELLFILRAFADVDANVTAATIIKDRATSKLKANNIDLPKCLALFIANPNYNAVLDYLKTIKNPVEIVRAIACLPHDLCSNHSVSHTIKQTIDTYLKNIVFGNLPKETDFFAHLLANLVILGEKQIVRNCIEWLIKQKSVDSVAVVQKTTALLKDSPFIGLSGLEVPSALFQDIAIMSSQSTGHLTYTFIPYHLFVDKDFAQALYDVSKASSSTDPDQKHVNIICDTVKRKILGFLKNTLKLTSIDCSEYSVMSNSKQDNDSITIYTLHYRWSNNEATFMDKGGLINGTIEVDRSTGNIKCSDFSIVFIGRVSKELSATLKSSTLDTRQLSPAYQRTTFINLLPGISKNSILLQTENKEYDSWLLKEILLNDLFADSGIVETNEYALQLFRGNKLLTLDAIKIIKNQLGFNTNTDSSLLQIRQKLIDYLVEYIKNFSDKAEQRDELKYLFALNPIQLSNEDKRLLLLDVYNQCHIVPLSELIPLYKQIMEIQDASSEIPGRLVCYCVQLIIPDQQPGLDRGSSDFSLYRDSPLKLLLLVHNVFNEIKRRQGELFSFFKLKDSIDQCIKRTVSANDAICELDSFWKLFSEYVEMEIQYSGEVLAQKIIATPLDQMVTQGSTSRNVFYDLFFKWMKLNLGSSLDSYHLANCLRMFTSIWKSAIQALEQKWQKEGRSNSTILSLKTQYFNIYCEEALYLFEVCLFENIDPEARKRDWNVMQTEILDLINQMIKDQEKKAVNIEQSMFKLCILMLKICRSSIGGYDDVITAGMEFFLEHILHGAIQRIDWKQYPENAISSLIQTIQTLYVYNFSFKDNPLNKIDMNEFSPYAKEYSDVLLKSILLVVEKIRLGFNASHERQLESPANAVPLLNELKNKNYAFILSHLASYADADYKQAIISAFTNEPTLKETLQQITNYVLALPIPDERGDKQARVFALQAKCAAIRNTFGLKATISMPPPSSSRSPSSSPSKFRFHLAYLVKGGSFWAPLMPSPSPQGQRQSPKPSTPDALVMAVSGFIGGTPISTPTPSVSPITGPRAPYVLSSTATSPISGSPEPFVLTSTSTSPNYDDQEVFPLSQSLIQNSKKLALDSGDYKYSVVNGKLVKFEVQDVSAYDSSGRAMVCGANALPISNIGEVYPQLQHALNDSNLGSQIRTLCAEEIVGYIDQDTSEEYATIKANLEDSNNTADQGFLYLQQHMWVSILKLLWIADKDFASNKKRVLAAIDAITERTKSNDSASLLNFCKNPEFRVCEAYIASMKNGENTLGIGVIKAFALVKKLKLQLFDDHNVEGYEDLFCGMRNSVGIITGNEDFHTMYFAHGHYKLLIHSTFNDGEYDSIMKNHFVSYVQLCAKDLIARMQDLLCHIQISTPDTMFCEKCNELLAEVETFIDKNYVAVNKLLENDIARVLEKSEELNQCLLSANDSLSRFDAQPAPL